jgi:ClpP class serine protease
VNGANELAQAIYEARGTKPIVAYVGGSGASAAYWIASAADRIVVSPTAVLGSIGVQVAYREPKPRRPARSPTVRFLAIPEQKPGHRHEDGRDSNPANH